MLRGFPGEKRSCARGSDTDRPWRNAMKRKDTKKALGILALMAVAIGLFVAVYTFQRASCGDHLRWRFNRRTGTLTITGSGAMDDWDMNHPAPWDRLHEDVAAISLPPDLTHIGSWAFRDFSALTEVTIPEGVTSIGDHSFLICEVLSKVVLPSSVSDIGEKAFSGCRSLKDVTLPTGIKRIAFGTFAGCALREVTIPDGVTEIGAGAFSVCEDLREITIPESVKHIGARAFYFCSDLKEITIPDSVTSIGEKAFYYCERLRTIEIPQGVTSIADGTFQRCSELRSVILPDSLKVIGDEAFEECLLLHSIELPEGVTGIGEAAFRECDELAEVLMPEGLTSIGYGAFFGCSQLKEINVKERNTRYCSIGGVLFNADRTELICYPAGKSDGAYDVPQSVTSIAPEAFLDALFEELTIPEGVASIGSGAFRYCSNLKELTIPNSVTSDIDELMFNNCTHLYSITIPAGVTSIDMRAFEGCDWLRVIYGEEKTEAESCAKSRDSITFKTMDEKN